MTNFAFKSYRSAVYARHGMVATSQPLAAQTGLRVLQEGGNAVDAAIATMAMMCVVEPCSTGIGGDAFALIWSEKEKKLYGLNGSGPAPMALSADSLRKRGHAKFPELGGMAVTVPGSLRAWELALEKFGSKPLDYLLADAVDTAEMGYPVSPVIARAWERSVEKMSKQADSARVWLPSGRAPRIGEIFSNHEFASTLKTIAEQGIDAFYTGDIASQIVSAVQADGGLLRMEDLASYRGEWIEPIEATVSNSRGEKYTFHEIPPNGQGLTALLALNIVDRLDVRSLGYGTADYYHALIEAIKLGFADAMTYIADPNFAEIPLGGLLADSYSDQRSGLITEKAQIHAPGKPNLHGDTVYLTTADAEGNMVSWIQSLYMGFGSGLTAGTTGVQLQNRGANFSLEKGHFNEAQGGKRPFHTIIPGFITRNGEAYSSFGVMGGFMQPQGHLQVGLNLIEWGMDAQTALDAPRFCWFRDNEVAIEHSVQDQTQWDLARRGHRITPSVPGLFGGGQAIVRQDAVLCGGTEPRKDGVVAGY